MRVRMFDHVAHYERHREAIDAALQRVLASGQFVMGPDVRAFEEEFASYCGVAHAVGVMSGSSALQLALRACGVGPGDEVITVANSDIPTSHAIYHTGASIVWVDIENESYNLDPEMLEAALSPRTRAVLPVHLYGVPADMAPILAFAKAHDLVVVEDAALATGATYRGKRVGTLGTLTAFSTAPGKVLDGIGSGGIVTTQNRALYDRLNRLRHYGRSQAPYKEVHGVEAPLPTETLEPGFNERLDTVQAAVLRVHLRHLDDDLAWRRMLATHYQQRFAGTGVRVQAFPPESEPAWRVFTVRVAERDRIYRALYADGFEVTLPYLPANYLDACYQSLGYSEGSLPRTEAFCRELLALPCHPYMPLGDADALATALLALL